MKRAGDELEPLPGPQMALAAHVVDPEDEPPVHVQGSITNDASQPLAGSHDMGARKRVAGHDLRAEDETPVEAL